MTDGRDTYFYDHPDPMLIYDTRTYRFLDVNRAAERFYGYGRDAFLEMTIMDIRPEEDQEAVVQLVRNMPEGHHETEGWRHRLKSGQIIYVNIASRPLDFGGADARLVSVRDVTRLVEAEREKENLLQRERRARREAENAAEHFKALFEAVPGQFFVLTPDDYRIEAVSDTCLEITGTTREEIKGRKLFDIFPPPPSEPGFEGARLVRASFRKVVETGLSDAMPRVRYPIRNNTTGEFEERAWAPVNTPVRGPGGNVIYVVCQIDDVSDQNRAAPPGADASEPRSDMSPMALDLQLRSRELDLARRQLQKREATLKNAQRLAHLGHWELDPATDQAHWSPEIYELFGLSPETYGNTREEFLEFVHPEDRARYIERQSDAIRKNGSFEAEFRVRADDGSDRTMREVGEMVEIGERPILSVLTQDITDIRRTEARAERISDLLRIAGRMARLGGWRVALDTERIFWGEGTAAIHDMPADSLPPSLDEAFEFYVEEHRDRIRDAFWSSVTDGTDFDETVQIISATGRRKWVRVIGEPERGPNGTIRHIRGAFQDISEFMSMREEARTLSERLMHTLESISDAFLTLDFEWRFGFLNSRAEELLGRSAIDLKGKVIWEEFPAAETGRFKSEYRTAMHERKTVRFVEYYPAPLEVWLQVSAYPTDEGLAVYFRDVSEERKRDEQLRLLETAVSRQSDILLITEAEPIDMPGPRIVYVNEAFESITGFSRDEVIGATPRILQGQKTQRSELDRIRAALEADQPVRAELLCHRKDGSEFWLEMDITPVFGEDGKPAYFVAVERDITERKASEKALLLSEERFHLLSKATEDVIWDWDISSDIIWWNDNMTSTFGYSTSRVIRGPDAWENRLHPEDRPRVVAAFEEMLNGAGSSWQDEYRYLRADGSVAHVVDRGVVMRDEHGAAMRVLGSMIDVTERKQDEERLRQSQKMEAVGQLTGGVAHDMNNLLTIIMGNSELLSDGLADRTELQAQVESIISAAERGADLSHRLLAFSRKQPLEPRPTNASDLAATMKDLLRRTLSESIEIQMSLADDLWITDVDPGQLELAILNIVLNAQDAMTGGGWLMIETSNTRLDKTYASSHLEVEPGEYVAISISDTGPGMAPDIRDKAFDPFFTTKPPGRGTGLGLSMVFGFAKQSGGHAKIYSESGEGTTVKLYLPRVQGLGIPAPTEQPESAASGGTEHILVVEDDDTVREHLLSQLSRFGYRVTSASNGPDALKVLAHAGDIDLLFTDIVMPGGMNGRELADAAREVRPKLKVLFTSGYSENAIVHHGRLDEGVQFLGKPYRQADLAAKIRQVLDE